MLSKLRFNRPLSDDDLRSHREGFSPERVLASINWQDSVVERVEHGTLSASFVVHGNNQTAFLKTHLTSEGRASLEREARFLTRLYGETLSLEFQYLQEPDADRQWLMMPVFRKNPTPLLPEETVQLLNGLGMQRIRQSCPDIIDAHQDNINTLIEFGKSAHINLSSRNLLDREAQATTLAALHLLDRQIQGLQTTLCHGDLSPVNIMRYNGEPILIDWEDAFLGVTDYDYLFWLTFFENRKLYRENPLQHISIDPKVAKALLVLIVLLKCELAWRNNTWRQNSLSFNARIIEIANLN